MTDHEQNSACISLLVPASSDHKLNELIREARRLNLLEAVTGSLCAGMKSAEGGYRGIDPHFREQLIQEAAANIATALQKQT